MFGADLQGNIQQLLVEVHLKIFPSITLDTCG